jgi:hypothetical protein
VLELSSYPGVTVKFVALVAMPPIAVTTIGPLGAESGTRAWSVPPFTMRKEALTPPTVTP